jgi:hypothetical protein
MVLTLSERTRRSKQRLDLVRLHQRRARSLRVS